MTKGCLLGQRGNESVGRKKSSDIDPDPILPSLHFITPPLPLQQSDHPALITHLRGAQLHSLHTRLLVNMD